MHEMKFYQIDTNYLNLLRQLDGRVPYNKEFIGRKGKTRPYIGVMLSIDGVDYFVPLSSRKRRSSFVVMPIYDGNNEQVASLMLNNMLPVPFKHRKFLNMDGVRATDPKYFDLLINELNFLRPRKDTIKSRCEIIRSVMVEGKDKPQINGKIKEFCLNLVVLEDVYKNNS